MSRQPTVSLGAQGRFLRRQIRLSAQQAQTHWHLIGTSGSGKSRYLAHLWLSFVLDAGLPATLIDPHGDTVRLVVAQLIQRGIYAREEAYRRIVYLDIPGAARRGLYLPFNVLAQPAAPHTVASSVKEAMHRAWPALADGAAPMFDTLIQDGCKVLISNGQPITALFRLLTDQHYRQELLQQEADPEVVSFFRDMFDQLSPRDRIDQAGAALRRAHLLTFAPVLRYSLGQEQSLDFGGMLAGGASLLVNLALDDHEARRLFGCLWTVALEQAAMARAGQPAGERTGTHHLLIDEFSEFVSQSEASFAHMLSQTRKYGLFLVAAHQTWSQASARLRGALQNVGVEVAFRLGREDAVVMAPLLGTVNPMEVKHVVSDAAAVGRTHPVYSPVSEQWERLAAELQELERGVAYVKTSQARLPGLRGWLCTRPPMGLYKVRTPAVPDVAGDPAVLADIEAEYLRRYFRPPVVNTQQPTSSRPRTRRRGVAG